jgi:hypothetical protein
VDLTFENMAAVAKGFGLKAFRIKSSRELKGRPGQSLWHPGSGFSGYGYRIGAKRTSPPGFLLAEEGEQERKNLKI